MKAVGVVLTLAGAALAVYSIPFVTWVAFAFFLLGIAGIILGVRLALDGGRSHARKSVSGPRRAS